MSQIGLVLYLIGRDVVFWTNHRAKWWKANVIPVTCDTRLELLITNKNSKSGKCAKKWMTKPKLLLVLYLIFWEAGSSFLPNQSYPGFLSTLTNKLPFDTVPHCVTQHYTEYPGFMFTSLQHNGVFIASSKRSLDTSTDNCGNGFMMTAPPPLLKLYSRLLISFKTLWTVTLDYLNILTRDSVSLHKTSF